LLWSEIEFALGEAHVEPRPVVPDEKQILAAAPEHDPAMGALERLFARGDHQVEIDALLDARSTNWRLSRMAATDRAVLRIAAFELLHTDTPGPVVVDEAIKLARRYGSQDSPTFVAGILGAILDDRGGRSRPAAG
jgi:transcription antitermination factor NusB